MRRSLYFLYRLREDRREHFQCFPDREGRFPAVAATGGQNTDHFCAVREWDNINGIFTQRVQNVVRMESQLLEVADIGGLSAADNLGHEVALMGITQKSFRVRQMIDLGIKLFE